MTRREEAAAAAAGSETNLSLLSLKVTAQTRLAHYAALTRQLLTTIQDAAERPQDAAISAPLSSLPTYALMEQLLIADAQFQSSVEELHAHQRFQRRIDDVQAEVRRLDDQLDALVRNLRVAETQLEGALDRGRSRLASMQQADARGVTVDDIVSYARRISYTTAAPPQFTGKGPLAPSMPPAPREEQMALSLLYRKAGAWSDAAPTTAVAAGVAGAAQEAVKGAASLQASIQLPMQADDVQADEDYSLDL